MANIKEEQSLLYKKMILNGRGRITLNPDLAVIRLGVQTTGENLSEAQSENALISRNVLNALHQMGVTDIKTFQYQIEKIFDFENGQRIDRGYSVRNILEIRMSDLELVGAVIDTAVSWGANVVDLISFEVSDYDTYYQQALNLAVKNAFQKAKNISAGLRIAFEPVPVLIQEIGNQPIPYSPLQFARGEVAATPIEPGTIQIEANVTVEFVY